MTFKKDKPKLAVLTYIDRDNAAWQVESGTYEEQPCIRIMVTEEGCSPKAVVFHEDDAEMLSILIEQARK